MVKTRRARRLLTVVSPAEASLPPGSVAVEVPVFEEELLVYLQLPLVFVQELLADCGTWSKTLFR